MIADKHDKLADIMERVSLSLSDRKRMPCGNAQSDTARIRDPAHCGRAKCGVCYPPPTRKTT
jgi:hypothetical protein